MWCFHKYGKIEEGYQYCEKCGKARLVGCNHKWEKIRTLVRSRTSLRTGQECEYGEVYVMQCEKCGMMDEHEVR